MSDSKIPTDKAEERFFKRVLDVKGHKVTITWGKLSQDRWNEGRQEFTLTCSCGVPITGWQGRWSTNADGAIGKHVLTGVNSHIQQARVNEGISREPVEDAKLLMRVPMLRGLEHEYWAVDVRDTDFFEGIKKRPPNVATMYRYQVWFRDSRGKWDQWGWFENLEEAAGAVSKRRWKYTSDGKLPLMMYETDAGAQSPAISVSVAVRKLIDDFAEIDKSNPIIVKPWLDRVDDALTQMDLLAQLRDEVRNHLLSGMEL